MARARRRGLVRYWVLAWSDAISAHVLKGSFVSLPRARAFASRLRRSGHTHVYVSFGGRR
jgi:hypothetical protein